MKIFLGNPPWEKDGRFGVRAGSRWPFTQRGSRSGYIPFPFYLAYATSLLEKNGFDVKLVDGIAERQTHAEFMRSTEAYSPDIVLFETSTPSIYSDLKTAKDAKDALDAKIVLSGPHVSAMGGKILEENPWIDYVITGEYEQTLLNLVKALEQDGDIESASGHIYQRNGRMIANDTSPLADLDELPWPARHHLPMYRYNDDFGCLPKPNVQMLSSRGCPYGCIFCVFPQVMYGGTYRKRSPQDVVDEMEFLVDKYNFKAVYFDDDTFNIDGGHVRAVCMEIRQRGIDVPWGAMGRADLMNERILQEMKDAGMCAIKYGIESASQSLLDQSGKKLDLKRAMESIKLTQKLGIKVHLTFMFGLPGETRETAVETLHTAMEIAPDSAQFSIAVPFPGTRFYEIAEEQGILLTKDWSRYDGTCSPVIETEGMDKGELEYILSASQKEWMRHTIRSKIRCDPTGYIIKGLSHPIKGIKELSRVWFDL